MAQGINEMLDRLAAATSEQARLTLLATDQQQLAETALAEMSDGLLAFGADGTCSVCNPAAGRLLGLHPTRALGRHFSELLPGLNGAPADAAVGPQLVEMNGRTVAVTRNSSQGAGARSSVAVLRDVTEILDIEGMKRDIIGTVSHELRTPLTAIRATVDLFGAGDAGELTDVQQRMVLLLGRNVDRLAHIVNDLLDLTSLESGRVTLDHSAVDMAVACERVAEDLRPAATAAQIEITVEASSAVAWADAGRIRQVLENLVQNAIKFSKPGGLVHLSAVRDGAEVVVRVQDQGIGIAVDEHARVFEKFYRTPAGSRAAQGTGLG
ncbi:MAG: histidine kinase dimerization/phospho-acceptor domain-containing protein, partial [Dehalococcoidia bacterium]|nr:histidine kinase dimerization/phospho-acceptor domain-containing protein [Dehalococcoidia bacterium]